MKLLLIAGFPDSLIHFRGPLIDALLEANVTVHVAAPGLGKDSAVRSQLEERGVHVHDIVLHRTGTNPFWDLVTLCQLWRVMRCIQPRIVLGYTIKPVIFGSLASRLAGVPRTYALITGLGYAFLGDGRRARLRGLVEGLYRAALRQVDKVFFQNPDDEQLFRSTGIVSSEMTTVVLNGSGIDVSNFAPAPLPEGARCLLIARLLGDKGVREYARAARVLKLRHPEATFALAGWIDTNPDAIAQEELDEWVGSGAIEFLGRLDDVRPAIEAASVYVLPSYREGTPRTVLEAMAMGRPVVTSDAPGCRETVIEGENGLLVPVRSVEPLVSAIERLIVDPELRARMGRRSREIACGRFDVRAVNERMLREMGIPC